MGTVFLGGASAILAAYVYTVPLLFVVFWEREQVVEADPSAADIVLGSLLYGVFGVMASFWATIPFGCLLAVAASFWSRKYGSRNAAVMTGILAFLGGSLLATGLDGNVASGLWLYTSLGVYCGSCGLLAGYYYSSVLAWVGGSDG